MIEVAVGWTAAPVALGTRRRAGGDPTGSTAYAFSAAARCCGPTGRAAAGAAVRPTPCSPARWCSARTRARRSSDPASTRTRPWSGATAATTDLRWQVETESVGHPPAAAGPALRVDPSPTGWCNKFRCRGRLAGGRSPRARRGRRRDRDHDTELRITDLGVIARPSSTLAGTHGGDRRDRRRQDHGGHRTSTCCSARGPTPAGTTRGHPVRWSKGLAGRRRHLRTTWRTWMRWSEDGEVLVARQISPARTRAFSVVSRCRSAKVAEVVGDWSTCTGSPSRSGWQDRAAARGARPLRRARACTGRASGTPTPSSGADGSPCRTGPAERRGAGAGP